MDFFRLAAAQGHANVQFLTGIFLLLCTGVAKGSKEEAAPFLLLAEDHCNAAAQCLIGQLLSHGMAGLPLDEAEEASLYCCTADQGYARAAGLLGVLLIKGHAQARVSKDKREAVWYFTIMANGGSSFGQYHLGLCYQFGLGG